MTGSPNLLSRLRRGTQARWLPGRYVAAVAAVLGPPALSWVLSLLRSGVSTADAALMLLALTAAVAACGRRAHAVVAALSAGVWFDYFLVPPYHHFAIDTRADIETTALLLVVGLGVTELAIWGRRRNADAERQAGYLDGLHTASGVLADGGSPTLLAERIAALLSEVLGLAGCHFRFDIDPHAPTLHHDGSMTWGETTWDIEVNGLPLSCQTQLVVSAGGRQRGRFLMTPRADSHPSLPARQAAATLAAQVGAALNDYDHGTL